MNARTAATVTKIRSDSHEDLQRDEDFKHSSNRSFGLTFAVVFLLIAAVSWWRGGPLWPYLGVLAAGFAATALVVPGILSQPNLLWARFGLLLHRIVNPAIMGLLYFATVTPIALVMRLAGKDFLRLKLDPDADSYWIERNPPGPAADSMRQQY